MKNKRKSLSSSIGVLFVLCILIASTLVIFFAIYSIIIKDYSGLIACLVFMIFIFMTFLRRLLKVESVEFDKDNLYIKDGYKIGLAQIQKIEDGKIIYLENEIEKTIFVNPYFPSKNHRLFTKYYKSKKEGER